MSRFLLAAALLAGACCAGPAVAQQSKVGDWTIEKRTQDTHCNASRGYKDKDDENRDYVIVITYSDRAIVIVMIYDGWQWDKVGEIMDRLSKAKRLTLDFQDDDEDSIEMQIPRAGEALAALKFCEENRK
jgi:hypothetical protein